MESKELCESQKKKEEASAKNCHRVAARRPTRQGDGGGWGWRSGEFIDRETQVDDSRGLNDYRDGSQRRGRDKARGGVFGRQAMG